MANYQSAYTGAQHDLYTTRQTLINLIYPVGAIYISVTSTDPSSLFGGTWERIKDQFLLCAGDAYTAGSTGGNATHSHTTQAHTLTVNEMPKHSHAQYANVGNALNGQTNLDDIPGCSNINAQNVLVGARRTTEEGGGGRAYPRRYWHRKFFTSIFSSVCLVAYGLNKGGANYE